MAVAAAVQEDRPQVGHANADGDTVTIVFSDIESSTERALALGDGRWYEVLQEHNRIVRTNLRHFGGTEIKSQGDGFMLTFQSARRAVQFCTAVQQELASWARKHPDDAVRIRIGLHTGEAIVDDDGDLFGKHIIVAARIANLADGGQILVSNVVKEITSSRGDLAFGDPIEVTLKGIDGPQPVYEVLWDA
jgi:class 3 adenylate cyclase